MKVLLTAPPGVGKSTVVQKFIEKFPGKMTGIVAKEIRNESNERVGFKNINLSGDESVFMHVDQINSDILVGNKYKVDVDAINKFVIPEISDGIDTDSVIIIDEIGRAQSNSNMFLETISKLLDSDANILATIVYDEEPWALGIKSHPDIELIEVTEDNRDSLPEELVQMFREED